MSSKYVVKTSEQVGRYAVASEDLKAGDEVLTEIPFAYGPKPCSPPVCLGCYTPVDARKTCKKCCWPVCSEECSQSIDHAGECQVLGTAKAKYQGVVGDMEPCPQYECITPLRVLLAMEAKPEIWASEVDVMMDHKCSRADGSQWNKDQINVVKYLRTGCKLGDRFSEELIQKVCGILEVNSFEIITSKGFPIRGIFPQSAILSHSCVANTCHSILPEENYRIVMRTTVGVKAGEELFCSYTGCLQPTLLRRQNLLATKFFPCKCQRCVDPTELNTNMSSLKCTKCDPGLILSSNPLDESAPWKCSHCEFQVTGVGIQRIYEEIKKDIDEVEVMDFGAHQLEMAEKILAKYKSVLHPNHGLNVLLWHTLIQLYGRAEGYTIEELPDVMLERKIDLCKALLKILDVVEPGFTRIRGLTLYEYHVVLMLFARGRFQYGELNPGAFKKTMEEVANLLGEAVEILQLEAFTCPEGALARHAATSLNTLRASLASFPES